MSLLRRVTGLAAGVAVAALALTGCVAGEGSSAAPAGSAGTTTLKIDWATYNPLSLIIKDQHWLEDEGYDVQWTQSLGSSKANEALRAGAIDFGSTAGSAALLARANGQPQQIVDVVAQPEWAALVVPAGSSITSVADLKGKKVAAALGTDPYFFLVQALEQAGLSTQDVTVENLIHADGWAALQGGSVDAWAGLDPIMASAEAAGAQLLYRNVDFNSYSVLNASESIIEQHPEVVQDVVDAYEKARVWALANPDKTADILAKAASIDLAVAQKVISEREGLNVDPVPGDALTAVLTKIGAIQVANNDVASQQAIDDALKTLFAPQFAEKAKS
ncbi:aliphatic sulfonate ABC transporter substrate-binding protein [Microbacterium sp. SORGH_AS_0888]|uniref:aliphatic sulfonate ABC transporter substrate-binding protein n=1 Tax=Microbacterium sp. SORGH_AS_0888 TaxID=3041791 RepID=UPI002788F177|nr:aliphatic sulfonate ABC transporter substrate-binding protein [Microbacterium sp. SORGH_AS_0888]MDQ1128602.1 sulfonate transport system substrate-binding protein [Microbacterium sp. SORGH_AS_0888]